MSHTLHRTRLRPPHASFVAVAAQQINDRLGRIVAKQLPVIAFVVSDATPFNTGDKIPGGEARECRATKMRIAGKVIRRTNLSVGEIATPATGDADALADALGMIDKQNMPSTDTSLSGAHHTGRTGTDYDDIETHLFARVVTFL